MSFRASKNISTATCEHIPFLKKLEKKKIYRSSHKSLFCFCLVRCLTAFGMKSFFCRIWGTFPWNLVKQRQATWTSRCIEENVKCSGLGSQRQNGGVWTRFNELIWPLIYPALKMLLLKDQLDWLKKIKKTRSNNWNVNTYWKNSNPQMTEIELFQLNLLKLWIDNNNNNNKKCHSK